MSRYTYTVRIEPAAEGGYVAHVPSLSGCQVRGDTYEETIKNAKARIEDHLAELIEAGHEIPIESSPDDEQLPEDVDELLAELDEAIAEYERGEHAEFTAEDIIREGRQALKRKQLSVLEQKLVHATEQLDRGEGIPIEIVREEIRKKR